MIKIRQLSINGVITMLQNYLIVSHPHGIIAMSTVINFCTNATGIQEKLPLMNIKVCTLMGQFLVPLRRELILLHGMISCSKNSLKHLLNIENQINNIVVLVVGKFSIQIRLKSFKLFKIILKF